MLPPLSPGKCGNRTGKCGKQDFAGFAAPAGNLERGLEPAERVSESALAWRMFAVCPAPLLDAAQQYSAVHVVYVNASFRQGGQGLHRRFALRGLLRGVRRGID